MNASRMPQLLNSCLNLVHSCLLLQGVKGIDLISHRSSLLEMVVTVVLVCVSAIRFSAPQIRVREPKTSGIRVLVRKGTRYCKLQHSCLSVSSTNLQHGAFLPIQKLQICTVHSVSSDLDMQRVGLELAKSSQPTKPTAKTGLYWQ